MTLEGINRAKPNESFYKAINAFRILENVDKEDVPCIFISHQQADKDFANEVADFIMSKKIDVYFDEDDSDLKFARQANNHRKVTDSILKAIDASNYMLVIVSKNTARSLWVPFEIGYGYDKLNDLKILRHKGLNKSLLPAYLKTKIIIDGFISLESYIDKVKSKNRIYENLEKGERIKSLSDFSEHALENVLDPA